MKRLIFTTILIFAFCFMAFAQADKSPCPNIKIETPGVVNENVEKFSVSASFENGIDSSTSSFNWIIIKEGEVVRRNNEKAIEINTKNVGENFRVTILAENVDKKCQNLTMASVIVIPNLGSPYIIDEYENLAWKDEKPRLSNVVFTMKGQFKDKDLELFAFFEFNKKTSNIEKKARLTKVLNFLSSSGKLEKKHITFLISESKQERTYFQPVLKEFSDSYFCDNCIVIRGEDLEKIVNIFLTKPNNRKK